MNQVKLKELFRYKVERAKGLVHRSVNIPVDHNSSDLYIVEFPKSGITWMSTILLNYHFLLQEVNIRASYFNLEQFVPDIHVSRRIGSYKLFDSYRLIKSHAEFTTHYRHMIYLVRNPWSVFSSYQAFLNGNDHIQIDEVELLKSVQYGPIAWARHVSGWLHSKNRQKLLLIRFEDLREKSSSILTDLLGNLGVRINDTILQEAISLSSLDKMKQSDSLFRKMCPYKKFAFVRKGESQSGLSLDTKEKIYALCRNVVEEVYSSDEINEFMKS